MDSSLTPRPTGVMIHVQRGMTVYSSEGDEIGEVELVYLGQLTQPNADEVEQINRDVESEGEHVIVEALPEILHPGEVPTELMERMLNEGYLRVTRPGLEDTGSIILPDQIESVSEQGIYLIP